MIKSLHHTTITVQNMEESLHFYRDILGFKVILDKENIEDKDEIITTGIPGVKNHVILLQVGEQETGMVGLVEFLYPKREVLETNPHGTFPTTLVFVTDDCDEVYKRLKKAGEKPTSVPLNKTIPGVGSLRTFALLDPNGVFVEFAQFIS